MMITQLVKFLSLLRSRLALANVLLGQTAHRKSRQLLGVFLKIVHRILCRINPRRPRPSPPSSKTSKDGELVGRQRGHPSPTSPGSSLFPYTVVVDGVMVPLNETSFSINPRSTGDIFRNSSTAPALPERQLGSQLSLGFSSYPVTSKKGSTSRVATPSVSAADSTNSLPLCAPDLQDAVDVPHYRQKLQLPEPGQETRPPDIEVVQAPNDSPTSIHIPGAPPVLSDESVDNIGPNQPSDGVNSQGRGARTSHAQGSLSRPYSVTTNESLTHEILALDKIQYGLHPALPSETLRYIKRKKIVRKNTDISLSPQDCNAKRFLRGLVLPPGWKRLTHPEGGCYFYHLASGIYTDNEIYDPEELEQIHVKMNAIELFKRTIDDFPLDAHIVLNIYGDRPEDTQCYCVNHTDRMIFFLTEFHANWMDAWQEAEGAYSRHHLRHELEAQYWFFVHLYPDSIKLSQKVIDDLKDIFFFSNGDVATSAYSTSPYDSVEIKNLLNILPMLESHVKSQTSTVGSVEFIARTMFLICHNRFLNFYGEPCARLERDFSVYAPDVHLTTLQRVWVDKMLHTGVWKEIMSKFSSEWKELVIYATIMLNANVAFLAIQSVDVPAPSRSSAQILSYISTIANLACMILGLLLMKKNQTKGRGTTDLVYKYLEKQYSELTALEALAIMFSLPYALLMWGMVSFFVAFSLMCVRNADIQTRIVVISCIVLAAVYIFWCIYLAWETNPEDTSQDNRSLAYSQNAELDKARDEDNKRAEESEQDRDTESGGSYRSSARAVSTDPSFRPHPRAPGMETIMSLWNAFLCIFIRPGRRDIERGRNTDLELPNFYQTSGDHT